MQQAVHVAKVDPIAVLPEPTLFPPTLDPAPLVHLVESFMEQPHPISAAFCAAFATVTQYQAQLYLPPHRAGVAITAMVLPVAFAHRHFGHVVVAPAPRHASPLPLLHPFIRICASLLYSVEQQMLISSVRHPVPPLVREALTQREHEILQHFAQGAGADTIHQRLQLRPKTVSKHLEHIRAKLQVHTHLDMLVAAYHCELVPFIH